MKSRILRFILLCCLAFASASCRPMGQPFSVTLPATQRFDAAGTDGQTVNASLVVAAAPLYDGTAIPTVFVLPTWTPEPSQTRIVSASGTPTQTLTPTLTTTHRSQIALRSFTATPTASPTPTHDPMSGFATNTQPPSATPSNTPTVTNTAVPSTPITNGLQAAMTDPNGTPLPTWTPPPPDPSTQIQDHYFFGRPIADGGVNWVDRTYPYGSTAGGRLQPHLGVDMGNPNGTPILAAEAGVVFYAGDDISVVFGPQPDYYGHVVVIQHNVTTFDGLPVFTLYGHMDRFEVQTGQSVSRGQQIGTVGATGIAMGPHVHFEVRVGDPYNYGATRNPELWIRPYPGYGTLAGRTLDSAGNRLYDVTIKVQSIDITRYAFSYADDRVNPDSQFGEHYVLGDLPADYYEVTVGENGRVRFRQYVYIYPNRTTWLDIRLN